MFNRCNRKSQRKSIQLCVAIFFCSIFYMQGQGKMYISLGGFRELDNNSFLTEMDIGIQSRNHKYIYPAAEINVLKFWDDDYSSIGLGLRPALQFNVLNRESYKICVELKGGVIFMVPEYPKTILNFTGYLGPCVEMNMFEKNKLRIGAGFNHFSNAKKHGFITNPVWDSLGIMLGYQF